MQEGEIVLMSKFPPNPWKFLADSEWNVLCWLSDEPAPVNEFSINVPRIRLGARKEPYHHDAIDNLVSKGYITAQPTSNTSSRSRDVFISETGRKVLRLGRQAVKALKLGDTRA